MTVENIRRTQRQEKERSQPVRIVLTLITISVEDFKDREKRYYRELLLLRSCRKRLHYCTVEEMWLAWKKIFLWAFKNLDRHLLTALQRPRCDQTVH
jgi:hypothetical protein